MISIIICTPDSSRVGGIERNIAATIGVEFELIVIENAGSQYSLCQAYNLGVGRSRFRVLCFMHDDIVYHSQDWGREVIRHFEAPDVGMIGIGGTRFLSNIPTIWWAGGHKYLNATSGTVCHNCIDTNRRNGSESRYTVINPEQSDCTNVAVLDGLWFCVRKSVFEKIAFDEERFGAFHFYDLDLCMQVRKLGYRLLCLFGIRLEHVAASVLDRAWIEGCLAFYQKWKTSLPVSCVKLSSRQLWSVEYEALKAIRRVYAANDMSFSYRRIVEHMSLRRALRFHFTTWRSHQLS